MTPPQPERRESGATNPPRPESGALEALRQRAGKMLRELAAAETASPPEPREELLHELRTHQIELELQNEDLRKAQQELILSRDRYADLYDFAPVGYLTLSEQNCIHEANLTFAGLLGMERGALLKKPFTDFITAPDQDAFFLYMRSPHDSEERQTCRIHLVHAEGARIPVELDAQASPGSSPMVRLIVRDISHQVRIEAETHNLRERLLRAQKLESLGILAGGVAHDFNNILTSIVGNTDLAIRKVPPDTPVLQHLIEIQKASKRATELAAHMLAYSGHGSIRTTHIDLSELVRDSASVLHRLLPEGVTLACESASDLPRFRGDATQIRQVIMNLVINAAEAMENRSGSVEVMTSSRLYEEGDFSSFHPDSLAMLEKPPTPGNYVILEVMDTGCGMDAATRTNVFDPFFTTKFVGRGLGMSSVLGIVRGHHGLIRIQNRGNRGTSVTVIFPTSTPSVPQPPGT